MTTLTDSDIESRVAALVADVLGVDPGAITPATRAEEIGAWDSFALVRIVFALEAEYGVRLTMAEIEAIDGVPALVAAVRRGAGAGAGA
ncbi:acyl carrier protein [Aurantimonas marianensis]|uniref:Acyl carrier protein n=1 Tax=Aurantimonas marianensis TaxID=2920428 RepID=A0A9X2KE30_9HYPH|nr:acyl carrier protein [Aurantimonas marianensis]MCP3054998.1 acyl carrier protein [Aurantimonas marianensis]